MRKRRNGRRIQICRIICYAVVSLSLQLSVSAFACSTHSLFGQFEEKTKTHTQQLTLFKCADKVSYVFASSTITFYFALYLSNTILSVSLLYALNFGFHLDRRTIRGFAQYLRSTKDVHHNLTTQTHFNYYIFSRW